MNEIEFKAWPKIGRVSPFKATITEEIDGTNACIIIENGVNGLLLDRLDEAELSKAIEMLYDDPLLRERMGSANIEKSRRYLCSNLKEKYLAHYDSVTDS